MRVNVSPELTAEIERIGGDWQVELVVGEDACEREKTSGYHPACFHWQ